MRGATLSAGVIDRARARRRRRVLAVSAAAVTLGAVAGLGSAALIGSSPTGSQLQRVSPSVVLARTPDLGIAICPNVKPSSACGRIGLAVWLRRAARSVSANVDGHTVRLDASAAIPYNPAAGRAHTMFVGYFRWPTQLGVTIHFTRGPGRAAWWAPNPSDWPAPQVRIRINFGAGRAVLTTIRAPLQSGWG